MVLDDRTVAEDIRIEIDGDHDVGAEGTADGDRHRIDEGAVDQPAAADLDRLEDAREGVGSAHGVDQVAAGHPDLVSGGELGGDADEAARQILEALVGEMIDEQLGEPASGDQTAAGNVDVEQAEDAASGQAAGKGFDSVEDTGDIGASDDSADRGAGDDVGHQSPFVERAQDSDMRPPASGAAAERYADAISRLADWRDILA